MTDTTLLEIRTALAEMLSMAERNERMVEKVLDRACEEKEELAPVVNVAAPNVNVAAPTVNVAAPAVQVVAQSSAPIIHVMESDAKKKKVKLTVNRNASGFIESMEIETLTE
jgi:phage baseplate assembly protein gpV